MAQLPTAGEYVRFAALDVGLLGDQMTVEEGRALTFDHGTGLGCALDLVCEVGARSLLRDSRLMSCSRREDQRLVLEFISRQLC
jgi:hypothetical protein